LAGFRGRCGKSRKNGRKVETEGPRARRAGVPCLLGGKTCFKRELPNEGSKVLLRNEDSGGKKKLRATPVPRQLVSL